MNDCTSKTEVQPIADGRALLLTVDPTSVGAVMERLRALALEPRAVHQQLGTPSELPTLFMFFGEIRSPKGLKAVHGEHRSRPSKGWRRHLRRAKAR